MSGTTAHALSGHAGESLLERLNGVWHERSLQIFMVIVLAH